MEPPPSDPSILDAPGDHSKGAAPLSLHLIRHRKSSHHEKNPIEFDKPTTDNPNIPTIFVEKHDDHQQQDSPQSPIENGEMSTARLSGDGTESKRKNKNVHQILKDQVHKSQAHIHTISRKIGRGHLAAASARAGARLKRASSAPGSYSLSLSFSKKNLEFTDCGHTDFRISVGHHKKPVQYQASSIHSRPRFSSTYVRPTTPTDRGASQAQPVTSDQSGNGNMDQSSSSVVANRSWRERRLLSNLWLTSAATFRRMGKIEQAITAIQEAEAADESNENVWVQVSNFDFISGGKLIFSE